MENKIKVYRERMNMSQVELAERFGVTQGQVSKWENGRRSIKATVAMKLCDLFGVKFEELFVNKE